MSSATIFTVSIAVIILLIAVAARFFRILWLIGGIFGIGIGLYLLVLFRQPTGLVVLAAGLIWIRNYVIELRWERQLLQAVRYELTRNGGTFVSAGNVTEALGGSDIEAVANDIRKLQTSGLIPPQVWIAE